MIHTYVISETNQLNLSILIPEGYAGEEPEVLVKQPEEVIPEETLLKKGNISRFRGALKLTAG